jgi:hypothetical protein
MRPIAALVAHSERLGASEPWFLGAGLEQSGFYSGGTGRFSSLLERSEVTGILAETTLLYVCGALCDVREVAISDSPR